MRFVDTNILLYAASKAAGEEEKAGLALGLLDSEDLALSVQVLQEFYVQATRPSRPDAMSHEQASLLIESFLRFPVQEVTLALMKSALDTKARFQISYWDAAIVEAARALGCPTILTEDLSHGRDFSGVVIENPFHGLA
jgi:predicted nucleic acid-binding protein